MSCFEENDVSQNAYGGTEITKRGLAATISEELQEHFQIIASRVREIKENKIRIYAVHDLPEDPEISHLREVNSRNRFHKIIFNCNYHWNDCQLKLQIPFDNKIGVIETAVETIPFKPKNLSGERINLIYLSTPQRGLDLLVPVFIELSQKYPNIHLDVFSSFKIYGWDNMDEKFQPLYNKIKEHPQMTYHGFAPREVIVEALQEAHILAYPCIWRETACRVLIESMSAGLMCVHSNFGALADTSGQLTASYQFLEKTNEHKDIFAHCLEYAINNVLLEETQNYLKFVKSYADTRFNLVTIAKKWEKLMESLLSEFPNEESRKIQVPMWIYRTS